MTNNKSECCGECKLLKGWIEHLACPCHLPQNTEGENPLLEKFNNPETIRKAAELGAEDQNKMADSLRKQEERDFHPLDCQCIKCQMSSEFHHPDCEHCKEVREANVATKQEEECEHKNISPNVIGLADEVCNDCGSKKYMSNRLPTPKVATVEEERKCQNPQCGRKLPLHNDDNFCHNEHCEFKVATSEKKCEGCKYASFEHTCVDTPHESEDWEAEFNKLVWNDTKEDVQMVRDFIKQVESKTYQRGREEGSAKKGEAKRIFYMQGYEAGKAKLLSLAVQEIRKERRQLDARMDSDGFARDISFNSGLDKAESIISGVMKK